MVTQTFYTGPFISLASLLVLRLGNTPSEAANVLQVAHAYSLPRFTTTSENPILNRSSVLNL